MGRARRSETATAPKIVEPVVVPDRPEAAGKPPTQNLALYLDDADDLHKMKRRLRVSSVAEAFKRLLRGYLKAEIEKGEKEGAKR